MTVVFGRGSRLRRTAWGFLFGAVAAMVGIVVLIVLVLFNGPEQRYVDLSAVLAGVILGLVVVGGVLLSVDRRRP